MPRCDQSTYGCSARCFLNGFCQANLVSMLGSVINHMPDNTMCGPAFRHGVCMRGKCTFEDADDSVSQSTPSPLPSPTSEVVCPVDRLLVRCPMFGRRRCNKASRCSWCGQAGECRVSVCCFIYAFFLQLATITLISLSTVLIFPFSYHFSY